MSCGGGVRVLPSVRGGVPFPFAPVGAWRGFWRGFWGVVGVRIGAGVFVAVRGGFAPCRGCGVRVWRSVPPCGALWGVLTGFCGLGGCLYPSGRSAAVSGDFRPGGRCPLVGVFSVFFYKNAPALFVCG